MEENKELTVEQKIEKVREEIHKRKIDKVKLDTSLYTSYQLAEYRAKKAKNRVRNKMQKLSRKINRKK